jgi:hypothetical protein
MWYTLSFFFFETRRGLTLLPKLILHSCHQPILPVAATTGTSVHHRTQLKSYLCKNAEIEVFLQQILQKLDTQYFFLLKYGLDFSFSEFV